MQIKTTIYYYTSNRMAKIKNKTEHTKSGKDVK